ncbi:MAG TPA: alpha-amylase family glycosyl hydrolase [Bacteroidales bacterium]|nr:alpha-amylase family glycosyl hydrolase [Bacteroidales bacterium]HRZ77055.1 alpha-amylase family glycosyl hydrolase [Bacteroidales bacterium]
MMNPEPSYRRTDHKLIIYQLLPRLFGNLSQTNRPYGSREENGCGTLSGIDTPALRAIRELGCTHVWLTGIIDHATCTDHSFDGKPASPSETVKGRAGSPYAIRDYYSIAPDLSSGAGNGILEFRDLIARCHDQGLQVIIDHVPNHVARTYRSTQRPAGAMDLGAQDKPNLGFRLENDFYYLGPEALQLPEAAYGHARQQRPEDFQPSFVEQPARATGNDIFHINPGPDDWYETIKLNYGRSPQGQFLGHPGMPLWQKMRDILMFWADQGIAGFRCDMAAMVPPQYWDWVIREVRERHPALLFIAELYAPEEYETYLKAGFDYLYDKVGFYDTLRNVMTGVESAGALSRTWQQSGGFDHRMLRFVENHDEQRIASVHFCGGPEPGIPGMAAALFMHKGPVLFYSGQESGESGDESCGFSGEDGRTTLFDYWGLTRHQAWMNGGSFDGGSLDPSQQRILHEYGSLMRLASTEDVVRYGEFFDLQYAQEHGPHYDTSRCYSFLRHGSGSTLLFVLWFTEESSSLHVRIPALALSLSPLKDADMIRISSGPTPGAGDRTMAAAAIMETGIPFQAEAWSCTIFRLIPC